MRRCAPSYHGTSTPRNGLQNCRLAAFKDGRQEAAILYCLEPMMKVGSRDPRGFPWISDRRPLLPRRWSVEGQFQSTMDQSKVSRPWCPWPRCSAYATQLRIHEPRSGCFLDEVQPLRGSSSPQLVSAITQESGQVPRSFTTPTNPRILSSMARERSSGATKPQRQHRHQSATLTMARPPLLPPSPTCWRHRPGEKDFRPMTT